MLTVYLVTDNVLLKARLFTGDLAHKECMSSENNRVTFELKVPKVHDVVEYFYNLILLGEHWLVSTLCSGVFNLLYFT